MERLILLTSIVALILSSCTVFKDQCGYVNKTIKSNECYSDSCDLKNMLELIKLTKHKWSDIQFEDSGIVFLHDFLINDFPEEIEKYEEMIKSRPESHDKIENEIFKEFIRMIFYEATKNNYTLNQKSADSSIQRLTNWLFGVNQ